jgi:hypothetical protein
MRLINISTYAIDEFFGSKVPVFEYAILSRRWGDVVSC